MDYKLVVLYSLGMFVFSFATSPQDWKKKPFPKRVREWSSPGQFYSVFADSTMKQEPSGVTVVDEHQRDSVKSHVSAFKRLQTITQEFKGSLEQISGLSSKYVKGEVKVEELAGHASLINVISDTNSFSSRLREYSSTFHTFQENTRTSEREKERFGEISRLLASAKEDFDSIKEYVEKVKHNLRSYIHDTNKGGFSEQDIKQIIKDLKEKVDDTLAKEQSFIQLTDQAVEKLDEQIEEYK